MKESSPKQERTLDGIEVIIFDMDGTLYLLDGDDNGFDNSTLQQQVLRKSLDFIKEREQCSENKALQILDKARNNSVGISVGLAKRYGITREDYFNIAWDIEPEGIVREYEIPVKIIKSLDDKKKILVTSSPRVWQRKVFDFLGIEGHFERIYTGEAFSQKDEVFTRLCNEFGAAKIISIGDQLQTDIEPAEKLGIRTLFVSSPSLLDELC